MFVCLFLLLLYFGDSSYWKRSKLRFLGFSTCQISFILVIEKTLRMLTSFYFITLILGSLAIGKRSKLLGISTCQILLILVTEKNIKIRMLTSFFYYFYLGVSSYWKKEWLLANFYMSSFIDSSHWKNIKSRMLTKFLFYYFYFGVSSYWKRSDFLGISTSQILFILVTEKTLS